jgi:hypothetical protein
MSPDRDGGSRSAAPSRRLWETRAARIGAAVLAVLLLAGGITAALLGGGSHRHAPTAAAAAPATEAGTALPSCGASCDPIDKRYLSDLRFGATSFWIQPWRAYLDTWPASRLTAALGINFNVRPHQAAVAARLLHDTGFRLARIGTNWGSLSFSDPTRFADEASLRARLLALRDNGLRPLIVLDANSGAPSPGAPLTLETLAEAPAGARTVRLSPASAGAAVPGRSGFNAGAFPRESRLARKRRRHEEAGLTPAQRRARHRARRARQRARGVTPLVLLGRPAILITQVARDGTATLSRPLPYALAPGAHRGTTLLYAPFASPQLADGAPDPAFRATLAGWLGYVGVVTRLASSVLGPGGFDLEVWNELSFGSQFLDAAKYYSPAPPAVSKRVQAEVAKQLLRETVAYVRDPRHGLSPAVGITNGFASQSPFPSPAYSPAGLTALSKHPYATLRILPAEHQARGVPLDALGNRDSVGPAGSEGAHIPLFVPAYHSLFPEYTLTAATPENLVRDLAPFTSMIYKAAHGRNVAAPGGHPLQVWVTEYGLSSSKVTPVGPDGVTPLTGTVVSAADKAHFQAKVLLRSLVAMVNKGVSREYFYAATGAGDLSIINEAFMNAANANPGSYPGDSTGGETTTAFHNLLSQFQGPGPGANGARQLQLLSISQNGNHAQFKGDGTTAHPSLYDREVLAVLPFQSSPNRFTIPVYVMTRNLLTLYQPTAPSSDLQRYDLPDETFHITLGNLPQTNTPPTISAYDPITGQHTPARLTNRNGNTATIELAATDYPRILTIQYPQGSGG